MSSFEDGVPLDIPPAPNGADTEKTVIDGEPVPFTLGPGYLNLEGHPSTVRAQARGAQVRTMRSSITPTTADPAPLPPAATPERIQSVTEIATGGMGVVESAFDSVLLRRVAR
jgi:hypothetical protein